MKNTPQTVLIVDDIAFVRKTMKQILTSNGYKVIGEAENGVDAVKLYSEIMPDFVTMDLVMPQMNGVEAVQKIISKHPEACIFILSSMMQENLVTDAILAGAKDYIVKPFETAEVLSVIKEHLSPSHFGSETEAC